ncbi:STAS domain-containing protein [Longispora sp. K20-0274]|uniref:STAS domain-containing protein n=1 Tax=Longispora sp. K20-0274 TaxID=3088255 RepID=UPI00399BC0F4
MEQPVRGDVTRLSVFGEVTAVDGGTLMHAILQAVAGSDRPVVVDLTDATVRDNAIVDVLVAAHHAAGVARRDLTFTGEPSQIRAQLHREAHQRQNDAGDGRMRSTLDPRRRTLWS